jgi:hypothetical protein
MAFYAMAVQPTDADGAISRTFAGDGWQFKAAACVLFFAGLSTLAMKLWELVIQFGALDRSGLPPAPTGGQSLDDVDELLAELETAPRSAHDGFLWRRLRRALELVKQRGSADMLEGDLRALEDADQRGIKDRYGAVRLMAVSIPLVGLAAAAAGLASALGGVGGKSLDQVMPGVVEGVGVACGAVIEAAALAVLLLFAKLGVERTERRLLAAVDGRASRLLFGRFIAYGTGSDPHLASIQRMSEKVLESVESAAARHDAALSKSLATVSRRWEEMAAAASTMLHRSLGDAVAAGLDQHARSLNDAVARHTADLQGTLVRHAEILSENIDQHTAALADALEHHAAVMTETEKSLAVENQKRLHELGEESQRRLVELVQESQRQLVELVQESQRQLADMEASLGEAMLINATRQEKLIGRSEDMLKEMQVALVEAASHAVAQQEQLIKQSDVLLRVVDATGQVRKLEEALNGNLASLAGAHNFEQTMTSLAAAVQLLSIRVRQPAIVRNEVALGGGETTSQAA